MPNQSSFLSCIPVLRVDLAQFYDIKWCLSAGKRPACRPLSRWPGPHLPENKCFMHICSGGWPRDGRGLYAQSAHRPHFAPRESHEQGPLVVRYCAPTDHDSAVLPETTSRKASLVSHRSPLTPTQAAKVDPQRPPMDVAECQHHKSRITSDARGTILAPSLVTFQACSSSITVDLHTAGRTCLFPLPACPHFVAFHEKVHPLKLSDFIPTHNISWILGRGYAW